MRKYFSILLLFVVSTIFGQERDTLADLGIAGRVNEISVSHDQTVWLTTAIGKTFYNRDTNSTWSYGEEFKDTSQAWINRPNLERISFFNKDTAIMTGYIKGTKHKNNGYYYTVDACRTWELMEFDGSSWIYDVFIGRDGRAWMGGSSGEILYSEDNGINWMKLNSPFDSSSRMHYMYMLNNNEGISGALRSEIYLTSNNWQTYSKIETPLEQNKYESDDQASIDRIEKVIFWNNYIVVNQNGNIYYSRKDKIKWKEFNLELIDFELDQNTQELYAVTDDLRLVLYQSPSNFKHLTEVSLKNTPIGLSVMNESLYLLFPHYEFIKVNSKEVKHVLPYTTERKITKPRIVKQSNKFSWGSSFNHLYLSDNDGENWYRENKLDFYIAEIIPLNDSTAILWDGAYTNYLYSLNSHSAEKYVLNKPLDNFLNVPIENLKIISENSGCYHHAVDILDYVPYEELNMQVEKIKISADSNMTTFKRELSVSKLMDILCQINDDPSSIPALEQFNIVEEDKTNYLKLVDKRLSGQLSYRYGEEKINKKFYYKIINRLDKLDEGVIENVLNKSEGIWSTSSHRFVIKISNEKEETIKISRTFFNNSGPWHFPWLIEYNGKYFVNYNVELSRFIDNAIPEKFMSKGVFDNRFLIMAIADYLYSIEKK